MDKWTVRVDKQDYPADSFEVLSEWWRQGKIPNYSKIFDPETGKWVRAGDIVPRLTRNILLTTTPTLDGYRVLRYIDIESVEIVIGTGPFSEFISDFADFFGRRSSMFEQKLQAAKRAALQQLKYLAFERGANAVVGLDLDYTEFSGNRIGIIANGTLVEIEAQARST